MPGVEPVGFFVRNRFDTTRPAKVSGVEGEAQPAFLGTHRAGRLQACPAASGG